MDRHVVIVGGGPTAVSAFVHLTGVPGIRSIRLIAPNPIGCAPAFGASDPRLLCNTSVDVTSLRVEGESDLLRYLAARGWPVTRDDFVPRALVGQYVRERYRQYVTVAERNGSRVTHTPGKVTAVRGSPGDYRVVLEDGSSAAATDVLRCVGGDLPVVPEEVRAHTADPRLLTSPYPGRRLLHTIPVGAPVLVLGTKLSAVDAVLALCGAGRRVVMASPSGELPAVRTRLRRHRSAGLAEIWNRQLDQGGAPAGAHLARPLVALIRALGAGQPVRCGLSAHRGAHERLRHETHLARTGAVPWQDAIAEVIDALNQVLTSRSERVRHEVMAAHREAIARYVSAIPVANARRLLGHLDAGRLCVAPRYPERIDRSLGDGWTVTWPNGERQHVDWIVCATGFHAPTLRVAHDGELRLAGRQQAAEHPATITEDLRVIRSQEVTGERIWALGAAAQDRVPIVNYLRAAAQHAGAVAQAIAADTAATPEGTSA